MNEQRSEDVHAILRDMMKLAADMAQSSGMPSEFCDDHPRRASRGYWLIQLSKTHDRGRDWAMRLRALADRLSAKEN